MAEQAVDWSFFSMAKHLLAARADDSRVMSGSEWDAFCARLAEAGRLVAGGDIPAVPADRASAFRGLLQLLCFGLERMLGSADPARPVFSRAWPVHLFDYGAANPDGVYRTAALRDDVTYRISGTLGNAAFMSLEFFDGAAQAGSLLPRDLRPDASGRFGILLGPQERPGHWLQIVPATSHVLSREFFASWAGARPADLRIECLDDPAQGWPVLSADRVGRELDALGTWLAEAVRVFAGAQQRGMGQYRNAFDPRPSRPDSDLPAICHGYWDLRPDECLIVQTPAPGHGYWSLQMANSLWNTLDYANRQTSLNRAQAHVDADGMLRVVVAHTDPGVANWLDTLGHRQGTLLLRFMPAPVPGRPRRPRPRRSLLETRDDWMSGWGQDQGGTGQAGAGQAAGHPVPATLVVALSELPAHLPAATPRVTPAQRRAVLDERLRQVTRLQRA